jgi:hypothetical protein
MNEVNYDKQIASLHAEVVALREELEQKDEVIKIWFDLANEYSNIIEPIKAILSPIIHKEYQENMWRQPKVTIKADYDND